MRAFRNSSALAALAFALATPALHAQETTSAIRGQVVNAGGAPVADATVTILHQPSGTRSVVETDQSGNFNAQGLRVGGPYVVTVAVAGQPTQQFGDIQLTVGESYRLDAALGAEEIVVTAARGTVVAGLQTGTVTALDADAIAGIASVSRDVRDLVRRDPLASFNPDPRVRGISIAGSNARSNRFSVDGVQVGDDFGLNDGGLPSARGIISLEAIEQLTVKAAPFEVTEGDFQGGAINVVLKSGDNDFSASAFYIYGDDSLAGDKSFNNKRISGASIAPTSPTIRQEFTFKDYGGFVSGPIVKDKLFFALSYERLRERQINQFGEAGSGAPTEIAAVSRAEVDQVQSILQSVYSFDALGVARGLPEDDEKFSAKIDWNLADDHRLSASYIYHTNEVPRDVGNSTSGTTPTLGFQSNYYRLTERTHAGTVQVNSTWSDELTSELRLTHRDYARGQTSYAGNDFGQFRVCLDPVAPVGDPSNNTCVAPTGAAPSGEVLLGPDFSRQANALDTKNTGVSANLQYSRGNHNIKLLLEGNKVSVDNLFIQGQDGAFIFNSIADLQARRANRVEYQNSLTGDPRGASAIFGYTSYTVALQDTWDLTDDITVLGGLRFDWIDSESPVLNPNFLARYGYANNLTPKKGLLQPRFGFNWRPAERVRLNGGVGLFGGGTPDVWISNSFSVDGARTNSIDIQRLADGRFIDATIPVPAGTSAAAANTLRLVPAGVGEAALNNVNGLTIPSVVEQYLAARGASPNQTTNSIAPGFRMPGSWKFNLSARYDANLEKIGLGDNWEVVGNVLFAEVKNGLQWTDLRAVRLAGANAVLPDGRPRYDVSVGGNGDIQMQNTSEGRSRVYGIGVSKDFDFKTSGGVSIGASYTYADVDEVASLSSSTAGSNYGIASADPNLPTLGRAREEIKHNLKGSLGIRFNAFGDNETRVELFGERRSGRPYNFTFTDTTAGRSSVFGTIGGNGRHLFFVPDFSQAVTATGVGGRSRIGNVEFANQATLDGLRAIVQSTALQDHQGKIAPKYLGTSPTYTKFDLRVSQEIPFLFGKFKVFGDMENFLNLIDKDWNTYRVFADNVSLTNVSCVADGANTCARYLYTTANDQAATQFATASLWQVRVGVRFDF